MSSMPFLKSRQCPLLQEVSEVTDEDLNTCVTLPPNDMATIMVPILDAQNDSLTVKTLTGHDDSCLHYNNNNVFALVKVVSPFRTGNTGAFKKCVPGQTYDESMLSAQLFECTCDYGPCEDVYIKIQSPCSVSVCSIEVF